MPYCPECKQEQIEGLARCPLCRNFYVVQGCAACGAEVFPRERHCGACGETVCAERPSTLVDLAPASPGRRLLAATIDSLILVIFLQAGLQTDLGPWWAAPLLAVLYWGMLGSGGRQSPGQVLLGTIVLTDDRRPLALGRSLARSLLSLAWAATVVLPLASLRIPAADLPQRLTHSREWRAPDMG